MSYPARRLSVCTGCLFITELISQAEDGNDDDDVGSVQYAVAQDD